MANYSVEDVLQMVEEEDVEFIRLQFTDMFGTMKNIAITARELPRALNNEYIVDCSHIAGITSDQEPDMYLYPDPSTFVILPWRPQQSRVARLICDIYQPDGTPYEGSTRYLLQRTAAAAKKEGYSCCVNSECEFFLFHNDENGVPSTLTHEKAGYLDISPLDLGENARRDIVLTLEEMGIDVASSHHETSPGQHEIDFRFGEVNKVADCIMTFKMAVRTIAKRHGLHATFMPKPNNDGNGSGMHVHFSLFRDGKNVFVNPENPKELSQEAYYFIGGLFAHCKEMTLITNPLVNSYKRLVPGFEAPTRIDWSKNSSESILRIPNGKGLTTRIELRSPDSASNPYLVFALCLAAGLDGIRNKILPPDAPDYLPENLKEAISYFEKSRWIRELLGNEFCEEYLSVKKQEWQRYTRQVTDWEIEEYLYRI